MNTEFQDLNTDKKMDFETNEEKKARRQTERLLADDQ